MQSVTELIDPAAVGSGPESPTKSIHKISASDKDERKKKLLSQLDLQADHLDVKQQQEGDD